MTSHYRVRKNVLHMTEREKSDFIRAVLTLKEKGIYDRYIAWHAAGGKFQTPPQPRFEEPEAESQNSGRGNGWNNRHNMGNTGDRSTAQPETNGELMDMSGGGRNAAHMGPAFLPWHREFLLRFEADLQSVNPRVVLPYWDWAADAKLEDPGKSPIWSPSFMGGNGNPANDNIVENGPFATDRWVVLDEEGNADGRLKRNFHASEGANTLPTQEDVRKALMAVPYDTPDWNMNSNPSFRNQLEGFINGPQLHNRVHTWIGGHMGYVPTAPNDPVFFLHHANVDRIWAMWQIIHPKQPYLPRRGGPHGQNYTDPMFPWNTTPKDVINHRKLGYVYDVEIERARRKAANSKR